MSIHTHAQEHLKYGHFHFGDAWKIEDAKIKVNH